MKYKVTSNIRHDGVDFTKDQVVDGGMFTADSLELLVKSNCLVVQETAEEAKTEDPLPESTASASEEVAPAESPKEPSEPQSPPPAPVPSLAQKIATDPQISGDVSAASGPVPQLS